jgi:glycosyltransferase involved in cell wall biosynthesis
MRTLHVAALPFPSFQGTQALVHAMLSALAEHGHDSELLTYAHGAGEFTGSFVLHRARSLVAGRSLRSGPSLEKLALDAGLALSLREREQAFRPDVVVAHHIEAAVAALLVCRAPVAYVAHTSLEAELPTYAPRLPTAPIAYTGALLERAVCKRAAHTLAVSPLLARMLSATGARVTPLELPWSVPLPITALEREDARRTLGLAPRELVLLYTGNLDGYQGLDVLVAAIAQLADQRDFTWLIATASDARALPQLTALGPRVRIVPLADEPARRLVHAAADVALVPRKSPGGVPIKLLDALARGVPVLAARRAAAGLPLDAVCDVVPDDDAAAWARALSAYVPDAERGARGRDYMVRSHHAHAFVSSFEAALCC